VTRSIAAEISGLQETQANMEQIVRDLSGQPMLDAMRRVVLLVQNRAKTLAPVDTGRLRASIMPEVRASEPNKIVGVVGSNVKYAPYMELGTGVFAGKSRYFPPPSALDVWARRHNIASGFLVARAIFMAGGTRPRHYLQQALEQNQRQIDDLLGNAVTRIING
jgi:HK97 gp10 family phage protein